MAKVFTTDAKISPLISLRVTVFPIAAVRQFFTMAIAIQLI